ISEESEENKNSSLTDDDGGYGWFVVIGSFIRLNTDDLLSFTGVILNLLESNIFGSSKTITMQLTFVGTIASFTTQLLTPISRLLETMFGVKITLLIATILYCIGMVTAGFSSKIWQLYLSLGICCGVAASIFWSISYRVTPQWFTRRRNLVMGIISSSIGTSASIIPFVLSAITNNKSFGIYWCFWVLAIVFVVLDIIVCILIREKKHPTDKSVDSANTSTTAVSKNQIIDWNLLRNMDFREVFMFIKTNIMLLCYYYDIAYAKSIGLNDFQASTFISITAGLNIFGRILQGYIAGKIGNLNTLILSSVFCGSASFFIWTFAVSYAGLLVYSIIFGIFIGTFYVIAAPTVVSIVGMKNLPTGNTLLWLLTAPGLFGPSISSEIERANNGRSYLTYQLFVGSSFTISILITLILKYRLNGTIFAKF
ncbi:major facilitator superfamily domain-containing protein, partial [Phascolomyces articulosus]